ncbi:pyrimidine reductase family protein [Streptomyces alkaliterrae]|uniref:Pyrimidine reductase family protein n=1 Tax=Streptomyces alkaliterrae TaxID=2213162 RepID=A0A5P0YQW9_9ACTN|nr:pyrimidine reductase family protein [Streptomyces alkaliterrae]MBB1260857.1 pyrimidine reductase family protein [Streptomyces alkaliterrae]MQS02706.1 pyrimidine reductase family protein [Streptomyces alkaliterrae]
MRRLFPLTADPTSAPTARPTSAPTAAAPAGVPLLGAPDSDREWSLEEIAEAYGYPPLGPDEAWLRANMVSSLDGAAYHDGASQPLSGAADMRVFGVLRGLADAVVVGAQTVRQEGYRPARARDAFRARRKAAGQPIAPAIAVVSSGLELDFDTPLFTDPLVPTLVLTGAGAPPERLARARRAGAEVLLAGEGAAVDPARVPGLLAERGLRRQLTEGGPRLLGQFAAAGVLDELCLTVSPRVTSGHAARITDGPALEVPADFTLESLLEESGFLFTRYRKVRRSPE